MAHVNLVWIGTDCVYDCGWFALTSGILKPGSAAISLVNAGPEGFAYPSGVRSTMLSGASGFLSGCLRELSTVLQRGSRKTSSQIRRE
jgi:hypothetical protein